MKVKAYLIAIPEDITLDDILETNDKFKDYTEDDCAASDIIDIVSNILYELKTKMITAQDNDNFPFYLLYNYFLNNNGIYGEFDIQGDSNIIINILNKDMTAGTKERLLQAALCNGVNWRDVLYDV